MIAENRCTFPPALTGYKARAEQAILFSVAAWDANCPMHIPQRFDASDVRAVLDSRDVKIVELEVQIDKLRASIK